MLITRIGIGVLVHPPSPLSTFEKVLKGVNVPEEISYVINKLTHFTDKPGSNIQYLLQDIYEQVNWLQPSFNDCDTFKHSASWNVTELKFRFVLHHVTPRGRFLAIRISAVIFLCPEDGVALIARGSVPPAATFPPTDSPIYCTKVVLATVCCATLTRWSCCWKNPTKPYTITCTCII